MLIKVKPPFTIEPESVGGSIAHIHQGRVAVRIEAAVCVSRPCIPILHAVHLPWVERFERTLWWDDVCNLLIGWIVRCGER
uniref:Uncharacterized protein n=1 Tax=Anopheles christyi TaxID=43041 RepID=A0A182KJ54_9DIPT